MDMKIALMDFDLGSERLDGADVHGDGAGADVASARQGQGAFAEAGHEWAHQADGGAHFPDLFI